MMEYSQIAKQTIDFQKSAFSGWYDAVVTVQDQASSAMEKMMDQVTWVPEEGRKAVQNWVNLCQEERVRFKSYVEAGFAGLEKHFAEETKTAPAKSAPKK